MKKKILSLFILFAFIFPLITEEAVSISIQGTPAYISENGEKSLEKQNIPVEIECNNPTVEKYLEKSYYSKTDKEILFYYEMAIKEIKKEKNPTTNDIETMAAIYTLIGDLKVKQNKIQEAFSCYSLGYNTLKSYKVNKNSMTALVCLIKILELAKKENNERYYNDAIATITNTQISQVENYPYLCTILSEYYKKKGDTKTAKYFEEKSKIKQYTVIKFNKILLKNERIGVTDEEAAKYIEKALDTKDISEQQKYIKKAIYYYYNKGKNDKKLNENDSKVLTVLLIMSADIEKEFINFKDALKLYKSAYDYMKKNNLHKNSLYALYCLLNIYYISQVFENKKLYDYSAKEMEKYELGLRNKTLYEELSSYYKEKGKTDKAEYYKNLSNN